MRRSVILPARSFTWAWGRPSGGGLVPLQGLVLILNPIGPERFRHAFKNAYWGPSVWLEADARKWRGRERRQNSLSIKKKTRLPPPQKNPNQQRAPAQAPHYSCRRGGPPAPETRPAVEGLCL